MTNSMASMMVPTTTAAAAPSSIAAAATVPPNNAKRRQRWTTPSAALFAMALFLAVAIVVAATVLFSIDTTRPMLSRDSSSSAPLSLSHHAHRFLTSSSSSSSSSHHHHHRHKKLLPLDTSDKLGFFFAILGLMIAAGGGIGGGGVLVPIYILVMRFPAKHAIPLSNITVFGGAVANTMLNIRKRHPLADRPLVDWDLILVMEPLTIAGALIGAFMNKLLPEAILVVSLVALLSFTAYTTLKKAIRMYRAESKAMLAEKGVARVRQDGSKESELARMAREMEDEDEEDRQAVALLDDVERHEGDNPGNMNMELCNNTTSNQNDEHDNDTTGAGEANDGNMNMNNENHENDSKNTRDVEKGRQSQTATQQQQLSRQSYFPHENTISNDDDDDDSSAFSSATDLKNKQDLAQILDEERHMPMGNIQVLTVTFAVILFINLLKGGGAFQSPLGIQCGSPSFWMANGIMLAWILLVSMFARSYLVRRYEIKERVSYPYVEGDIKWDPRATIVYPVICTAAGFFAGMFGVGGGIVKGPLMLAMGVHPKVSSASSACMILFTSFTATTSFVVFGLLDMEYAAICLTLGFVATLVGQIGLFYLMERFQRNSYIAFSIGGIVLLSAFLMTIQSLLSMAEKGGPKPPSGLCTGKQ